MKRNIIYFLLILLSSCGIRNEEIEIDNPVEVVDVEEEIVEEEIVEGRPVYHASEPILTDLIHTKLEVNFNWAKSRMNGIATITAKPHFYSSDSLILDAKGMDIHLVKMGEKTLIYNYDSSFLRIKLDKNYSRNDKYTVQISYTAKPDERNTSGSAAITSDKGLYFINPIGEDSTVMPQIWTQGETEASSVWFPTIDAPNIKTTQEIFITVEDKYATLSNGKLLSQRKIQTVQGQITGNKIYLMHLTYL